MSEPASPATPAPAAAPRVTGIVPHLMLRDAAAAAAFYQRAFGAIERIRMPMPNDTRLMHCHLEINGGALFVNDAFPEHGHPLVPPQGYALHLQVDDADAWWARATAAGAEVVQPLTLEFWGDRYGQLRDPFGVTWTIGCTPG